MKKFTNFIGLIIITAILILPLIFLKTGKILAENIPVTPPVTPIIILCAGPRNISCPNSSYKCQVSYRTINSDKAPWGRCVSR